MKRLNIFHKTFIYTLSIMVSILLVFHFSIVYFLPRFYFNEKKHDIQAQIEVLQNNLELLNTISIESYLESYAIQHNVNITLEMENEIIRKKGFTPIEVLVDPSVLPKTENDSFETNDKMEAHILIEQQDIKLSDGQEALLLLMTNINSVSELKGIIFQITPYSISISFLVALFAAYLYSNKLTKPISKMTDITKDMERLKEGSFIPITSEDEIGILGENINMMYDSLWQTIDTLEQKNKEASLMEKQKIDLLRAVSHELKTPLTALSVLIESMQLNIGKYKDRDTYLEEASQKVKETSKLVTQILNSTHIQNIFDDEHCEETSINKIIHDYMNQTEIITKKKQINLHLDEKMVLIHTHPEAFKKVISNIFNNAIQYTDPLGSVWIDINHDFLSIENTCEPLNEEDLSQIFNPFYRPDYSRNRKDGGTGLGLHIVKEILTHLNMPYYFETSNQGMKFTIYYKSR